MLSSTPDYVMSHVSDRTPGAGALDLARSRHLAKARYRRERPSRFSRIGAFVHRALPFANRGVEIDLVPVDPSTAT
jgi:hypothetical protein